MTPFSVARRSGLGDVQQNKYVYNRRAAPHLLARADVATVVSAGARKQRGAREMSVDGLKRLHAACESLDAGRPEDVLALLSGSVAEGDAAAADVLSAATALLAERAGDASGAGMRFDRLSAEGAPLPALLRACGRYFKRAGQVEKAFRCYSLMRDRMPNAALEFAEGLPEEELYRYSPWIVPDLATRLRLYWLKTVKRALVRRLGPESAALAFTQMLGWTSGCEVRTLRLTLLRDHARAQGSVYEELAEPRGVFLPPPAVFGDMAQPEGLQSRTRAFFFCELKDVVVSGKSNLLLAGDRALLDVEQHERDILELDLDVDFSVIAATHDAVSAIVDAAAPAEIDAAVSLVGVHSHTFGHWIGEFLPKFWACQQRPGFADLPILIDEGMPPQHVEALRFFVGPSQPFIVLAPGAAVKVRRLWTCSTLYYVPVGPRAIPPWRALNCPDGAALAHLIAGLRPRLEAADEPGGPKRLYLARKDSQHRRLVNRAEVERWAASEGFEIVDFGDLPFLKQLELIRGAEVIMGPDGSAMAMALFSRLGARLGAFSHPYIDQLVTYVHLYRDLGGHYAVMTGELTGENRDRNSDYRIDPARLPRFLEQLLAL